jgi:superfamily II RNA helicase
VQFKPDAWQVKLLNIVDAEESALICAPTSSGKTFVCFYAMESILRLDSNSVIVYIAPTKALVNQVDAEISARFSKQYAKGRNNISGVFTRDYRKNIYDCQILVTVPQCFEILMLSMEDPHWHKKVKYIIIDEVHMVGSIGGEVWQRSILLANAPSNIFFSRMLIKSF